MMAVDVGVSTRKVRDEHNSERGKSWDGAGPDPSQPADGDAGRPEGLSSADADDEGAPKQPRRARGSGNGEGDQSLLGIYFREMATARVMSPAEELEAAQRILAQRVAYWQAILNYPPFVDGIVEVIERTFASDDRPDALLRAVAGASRTLRDRQIRAHEEQFTADVNALAAAMARLDTDGEATEPIAADLRAIAAGRAQDARLTVTLPRHDSVPFRRYVDGVEAAGRKLWTSKHAFVRANLRLVVNMARRYAHTRMGLPDLIQEGNIGLLKAVDRFDPERGYRFSTYASWWIRHAISRAVADKAREVRIPVHMLDVHNRLRRTRQKFEATEGREPGDDELAENADIPIDRIRRLRMCLLDQGPSLDSPISGYDGRTAGEMLEDESTPQPLDGIASRLMDDKIREILDRLPEIEAAVLQRRFGLDESEPLTLREIGEQYSLSRERIRQLQEQALGRIRRELRRQQLM